LAHPGIIGQISLDISHLPFEDASRGGDLQ
jgi:hypothetical protein